MCIIYKYIYIYTYVSGGEAGHPFAAGVGAHSSAAAQDPYSCKSLRVYPIKSEGDCKFLILDC